MCLELPLRSSLEGVSQERIGHCSLITGCQEVAVRPTCLLALTGETYWRVLCSRILSRRAHVPLNSIGMLQICYERFSAARTPTPSRARARVHQLHAASIVCPVSCACAECVQGIDVICVNVNSMCSASPFEIHQVVLHPMHTVSLA